MSHRFTAAVAGELDAFIAGQVAPSRSRLAREKKRGKVRFE